MGEYIKMGECRKAHGIKGAMLFHLYNTEDSVLKAGAVVRLAPLSQESSLPNDGKEFRILSIEFATKTIVTLEGIADRTELERLLPFAIYFKRADFKALAEGEYYFSDLIGLTVLNEHKQKIGSVSSFYDNGAQIVLVIEGESETIELPFIDQFFPTINLAEKYIVMIVPELV